MSWVSELGQRSTGCIKHNNRHIQLSMSSSDHMIPIKFIETIQDVLMMRFAFNTQPRQELSICLCKIKGHLSANFAKSKYVTLMLYFLSVSYQSNNIIYSTNKLRKLFLRGYDKRSKTFKDF